MRSLSTVPLTTHLFNPLKFADDTTVIRSIQDGNKSAYRDDTPQLSSLSQYPSALVTGGDISGNYHFPSPEVGDQYNLNPQKSPAEGALSVTTATGVVEPALHHSH